MDLRLRRQRPRNNSINFDKYLVVNVKIRLDQLLIEKFLTNDLKKARAMIGAGEVYVNDKISDKAGKIFSPDSHIRIKQKCPYVSRGGLKLQKGLSHFNISPAGKICIDIGASTGGFTDCLLQHNAKKVYAVDVAYGQLSWQIRQNERVVVLERFNARNISQSNIDEPIDIAVIDASFISLTKLIPPLIPLFNKKITILTLIKPQFELPREKITAGGVIKDEELHNEAVAKVQGFIQQLNLLCRGWTESPILGPKGNKEFLMLISN